MDVVEILTHPESKTLEFKRDLSNPEGALKTIVAFANTAGGTLVVGVEDRSGRVCGVRDPLDLEERLANLISDLAFARLPASWSRRSATTSRSTGRCARTSARSSASR